MTDTTKASGVVEAVDGIKAVSSRTEKIKALRALMEESPLALLALKLAYDPMVVFNVAEKTLKKVEKVAAKNPNAFREGDFDESWLLGALDDEEGILTALKTRALSGSAAEERLVDVCGDLRPEAWTLLRRILLGDMRAGFTASSINAAWPGTIETFSCMLAKKFQPSAVADWSGYVLEPKLDGFRCLILVDTANPASLRAVSREGRPYENLMPHAEAVFECVDEGAWVVDGEILDASFAATATSVRKRGGDVSGSILHVFDMVPMDEFRAGASSETYLERRKRLEETFRPDETGLVQVVPRYLVRSEAECMALYERVRARGLEGLIVKPADHRYVTKRSADWGKMKAEETEDLEVVGSFEGEGKYEDMLGGLVVDRAGVEVRVGGGFDDADRRTLWGMREDLVGRVIEVLYHEVTPDGSLRHPRFVRFRDDKSADVAA